MSELCKCGKVGAISCPNDERCGKPINQLQADVQERIKADANATLKGKGVLGGFLEKRGYISGYITGATAEAERAQKQIRNLLEVLEKIVHAPVPANDREYISWFVTAKNVAGGAISEYEAQQWKEEKEVGDGIH